MRQKSNLYDGEYFEIIAHSDNGKSVMVQCKMCQSENSPKLHIRKCKTSNGNVFKHCDKYHPGFLQKIKTEKNVRSFSDQPAAKIKQPKLNTKKIKKEESTSSSSDDGDFSVADDDDDCDEDNKPLKEMESCTFIEADPFTEMIDIDGNNDNSHNSMNQRQAASSSSFAAKVNHSNSNNYIDNNATRLNREIVTLRKELMQKEFVELQNMRQQRHKFEMEILRAELEMKKVEHRKRVQWYEMQMKKLNS